MLLPLVVVAHVTVFLKMTYVNYHDQQKKAYSHYFYFFLRGFRYELTVRQKGVNTHTFMVKLSKMNAFTKQIGKK